MGRGPFSESIAGLKDWTPAGPDTLAPGAAASSSGSSPLSGDRKASQRAQRRRPIASSRRSWLGCEEHSLSKAAAFWGTSGSGGKESWAFSRKRFSKMGLPARLSTALAGLSESLGAAHHKYSVPLIINIKPIITPRFPRKRLSIRSHFLHLLPAVIDFSERATLIRCFN